MLAAASGAGAAISLRQGNFPGEAADDLSGLFATFAEMASRTTAIAAR
jgi:hypothetical protein